MEQVMRDYIKPGHETAFGGAGALAKHYKGQFKKQQLETELSKHDVYTTKREAKPIKQFNPVYTHRPRQLMQMDLVDVLDLSHLEPANNQGIHFLLCIIDSYTRYSWVIPLKNKTGKLVASALDKTFSSINIPHGCRVLSDRGSEFKNQYANAVYRKYHMTHQFPNSQTANKAPTVERYQRSLENVLWR
jgi:IS30 family transposase